MSGEPILVVDDNQVNLKVARLLLLANRYEVRTAEDAEQALATLEAFRPRLILMDLQLPGMDGLTLTKCLKADPATRDIVIVAMTAYAMNGDRERARASGCDGYITKPIDTRAFPRRVVDYLSRGAEWAGPD